MTALPVTLLERFRVPSEKDVAPRRRRPPEQLSHTSPSTAVLPLGYLSDSISDTLRLYDILVRLPTEIQIEILSRLELSDFRKLAVIKP